MSPRAQDAVVLFDLDGTLVDTAPDMAAALNRLRAAEGMAGLPFEQLRPWVSTGSRGLVRIGFGDELADGRYEQLCERFLAHYSEQLCQHSRPFEGMLEVLDELEARDCPWGVVTNKPGWLTRPLLRELGLLERAGCLVCGDTLPERKPHPMPLLKAAADLARPTTACVYVGDDERDVQAGRAAGMRTVIALYGYIPDELEPGSWGADGSIADPGALISWLDGG